MDQEVKEESLRMQELLQQNAQLELDRDKRLINSSLSIASLIRIPWSFQSFVESFRNSSIIKNDPPPPLSSPHTLPSLLTHSPPSSRTPLPSHVLLLTHSPPSSLHCTPPHSLPPSSPYPHPSHILPLHTHRNLEIESLNSMIAQLKLKPPPVEEGSTHPYYIKHLMTLYCTVNIVITSLLILLAAISPVHRPMSEADV